MAAVGLIVGVERSAYIGQLIFMGQLNDLGTTLAFLEQLRQLLRDKLQYLQTAKKDMGRSCAGFPDELGVVDFHEHLGLRMGILSLRSQLCWCDESLRWVGGRIAREIDSHD